MLNLTSLFQILVIPVLFSEFFLVGVAEPSGTVLGQKNRDEEPRHKNIEIETVETPKHVKFKETDNLEPKMNNKTKETNYFRKESIIPRENEYSKMATGEYRMGNNGLISRQKHSISLKNISAPQWKQLCGNFEPQPCTCYYPDHPNVTRFELDIDELTINASNINGIGPGSCEDLQTIGYKLAGFYMVRFKPKRVKAIYCSFNQTFLNFDHISNQPTQSSFKHGDAGSTEMIQFCSGLASQPCTFLYSDHPDIPLFHPEKNKTIADNSVSLGNNRLGPTNCDDLKLIGHKFQGFYIIRWNALKVKIIYCDFNLMEYAKERRKKRSSMTKTEATSPKIVTRVCKSLGSQPCSCYYSNFPKILQFELSDDESTRKAMHENGIGPSTCKELQNFGHSINGFYFLRLNNTTIKTAYCKLNETKQTPKTKKKPNNELTTIRTEPTSTILEITTEMSTTIKKKNKPKCDSNYYIFLLKNGNNGYCLKVGNENSLSMSKCNYSSPSQHWTQFRLLGSASWSHICLAYNDQCLTFATLLNNFFKHDFFLRPFVSHEYSQQKWVISDNGQLVNRSNGLRLVAYLKYPLNPPSYTANKWKFEMEAFMKEPLHKWSFLPVKDNNNVTLCVQN